MNENGMHAPRPGDPDEPDPGAPDPAFAPVEEAGGGVAEGFELAEQDLIEHAGDIEGGIPRSSQFDGEAEEFTPDPPSYGEADHERSTETEGEG